MDAIFQALKETPWWVYVLFIYLVYIGIKASQPGVVPLKKFYILTLVFGIWSLTDLINSDYHKSDILIWIGVLLVATGLGWLVHIGTVLQADKKKGLVTTKGTWSILIFILIIFSVKYYLGYSSSTAETEDLARHYRLFNYLFSAFVAGFFLGRALCYTYKYSKSNHTDLRS